MPRVLAGLHERVLDVMSINPRDHRGWVSALRWEEVRTLTDLLRALRLDIAWQEGWIDQQQRMEGPKWRL